MGPLMLGEQFMMRETSTWRNVVPHVVLFLVAYAAFMWLQWRPSLVTSGVGSSEAMSLINHAVTRSGASSIENTAAAPAAVADTSSPAVVTTRSLPVTADSADETSNAEDEIKRQQELQEKVSGLNASASDGNANVRAAAILRMSTVPPEQSVSLLQNAVASDPSVRNRVLAIKSLTSLARSSKDVDGNIRSVLRQAAASQEPQVAQNAQSALTSLTEALQ